MFKLLDSSISKSPEGRECKVFFRYLVQHKDLGLKVRVHITSDSYEEQCSAVAQVWSNATLSWNEVAHILPGEMETPAKLFYQQNWNTEHHFEDDYQSLLDTVHSIIA